MLDPGWTSGCTLVKPKWRLTEKDLLSNQNKSFDPFNTGSRLAAAELNDRDCKKRRPKMTPRLNESTVEPLIRHTPRETAKGMRYEGLCVMRGMPKIELVEKIRENEKQL
jgi:hypothetical protein